MIRNPLIPFLTCYHNGNPVVEVRFGKIVYFSRNRSIIHNEIKVITIGYPFKVPGIVRMQVDIQIADPYAELTVKLRF